MVEKFDYIESQADADELIAEFGQIGAIPRATFGEPDPSTPWKPGGEVTIFHRINCAVLPINLQDSGKDIGGTVIKSTDEQILGSVVGLAITPTTTDTIMVDGAFNGDIYEGGRSLTIVSCKTLAPAGVPVMHDILASA